MPIKLRDRKAALDGSRNQPEEELWLEGISEEEMVRRLCNDHRFEVTFESLKLEGDKTALFLENLSGPGVNSKNETTLSNRARRMVKRLYENGITNYIVSYGTDFGALALLEIAKAKEQYPKMTTIAAHIMGEWGHMLLPSSQRKFQQLLAIDQCDYYTVTGMSYEEFFRELLIVSAVLCTDIGMLKNTQHVRHDILFEYMLRNAFHKKYDNELSMPLFYETTPDEADDKMENSVSTECE